MTDVAKVFWNGRSQAVRLPQEYRFDSEQVEIRRCGNAVVLEPIAADWSWLDRVVGDLDPAFAKAADEEPTPQVRPALSVFE